MRIIGKSSQCSNCGTTFRITDENNVLYCSTKCDEAHDIFATKEVNFNEVTTKEEERQTQATVLYSFHATRERKSVAG
jgi:hypothetical protein